MRFFFFQNISNILPAQSTRVYSNFFAEFVSSHFQIRSYEPVIVCYDQFVSLISLIVDSL